MNKVHIFSTWFGAFPEIRSSSVAADEWCNGGIPQLANITRHKEAMSRDVAEFLPSDYDGFVVVDYEAWRAIWNTTGQAYHNASIRLVKSRNPGISDANATARALTEYNAAALDFLVTTLKYGKELLPNARWGLYGYPSHGYWGVNISRVHELNDALTPLWDASGALYPSIYLPYMSGVDQPLARNQEFVNGTIVEALRCAESNNLPVLPYTWFRYHPGEPHGNQLISDEDIKLEFVYPSTFGLPGVIVWGDEPSPQNASTVYNYFKEHCTDLLDSTPALSSVSPPRPAEPPARSIPRHDELLLSSVPEPTDGPIPPYKACSL